MIARVLSLVLLAGCLASESVRCPDGSLCPSDTTCRLLMNPEDTVCATRDALAACADIADFGTCGDMLRCYSGVCLPAGCGNGRVDPEEQCDDGNTRGQDGCSADCTSTEVCGNGAIDTFRSEICDDGNNRDHDACSSTCQVEELGWIQHVLAPPARTGAMAAYDPRRDRLVIFGGEAATGGARLNDLWEWNGADFAESRVPGPASRQASSLAFDGSNLVLYGGNGLTRFADTWTFDGSQWAIRSVAGQTPGARYAHVMAYDARRKRVVMFGGTRDGVSVLGDTWEWDGSTWTQVTPGVPTPAARMEPMMAYDAARGVIVLAGGHAFNSVPYADVWELDAGGWHDRTPSSGPMLTTGTMAFDPTSRRVIAFAGTGMQASSTNYASKTYAWTGTQWADLGLTTEPQARAQPAMAAMGSRIVMMGGGDSNGTTVRGDVWIFEGGSWAPAAAPSSRGTMFVNDYARHQIVLFGAGAQLDETWRLTDRGWVQHTTLPKPPPRESASSAYDWARRAVVLFSGDIALPAVLTDTWTWNGTWALRQSSEPPPGRFGGVSGFDGEHVIVANGVKPFNTLTDTWGWDGSTWTDATQLMQPSGIFGATATYDPVRNQMVFYGKDTWVHDAMGWTLLAPANHPANGGPMTWNPAWRRVVLTGSAGDAYAWNGTDWSTLTATNAPRHNGAAASSLDGTGTLIYDGTEMWELRWQGPGLDERCDQQDLDRDGLKGCDDPDCWRVCTPLCPPDASCPPDAPTCGDGTCDPNFETCRTCAADCTCTPMCGDLICDAGETSCPADCP